MDARFLVAIMLAALAAGYAVGYANGQERAYEAWTVVNAVDVDGAVP